MKTATQITFYVIYLLVFGTAIGFTCGYALAYRNTSTTKWKEEAIYWKQEALKRGYGVNTNTYLK